jgi:hypothetical protein
MVHLYTYSNAIIILLRPHVAINYMYVNTAVVYSVYSEISSSTEHFLMNNTPVELIYVS